MKSQKKLPEIIRQWGIVLILISLVTVPAFAQNGAALLKKKISVQLTNVPVTEVLQAISKQAACTFSYNNDQLKATGNVTIQYNNISLEEALSRLLGGQLSSVRVNGNQVFLKLQTNAGTVISGKVVTSDGKAADGVTLQLQGTAIKTVTGNDGTYELHAPEGKYQLTVSFTGLQTQTQQVTVKAEAAVTANFTLTENDNQLQEVLVSATRNKFNTKVTDDVARIPLSNLENAQVYNSVNNRLIKERTITNYSEIFYNVPGVAPPSVMYSNGHEYFLRGFYTGTEFRDGMSMINGETEDPVSIERVDVLKGPQGTLFGASLTSFGGVINNVSKQPFARTQGEVGYSTGSWGLNRLTLDYNTPLNKDSTVLFRINGARHWENTFQDYGFRHTYDIAPALTYKANDKLTFYLNAEFYSQNSTMWQWAYFGPDVTIKNIKDLKSPYDRSYAGDQLTQQWSNTRIMAQADYKISRHWLSSTKFMQDYYYRPESYYMNGNEYINDSTMSRWIMGAKPQLGTTEEVQQNFTGDFHIGKMRNRLLVGLDVMTLKYSSTFVGVYQDQIIMNDPTSKVNVSKDKILAAFTFDPSEYHFASSFYDYAVYATDILNITSRLIASASLRVDRFDNKNSVNGGIKQTDGYTQNAPSPKFGLVYQVVKDQVSLFANYMNGYANNQPQTNGTSMVTYKPSQANQWEGGVKTDLFENKLSATVSYYNIDVKNALRSVNSSAVQLQDATMKSKGVEAQFIANPLSGLNIIAGYGYNNAKYIKGNEGAVTLSTGAPHHTANFYSSYKIPVGKMSGFGLGFGANYVGSSDYNYPVIIPSYFICNISMMYDRPKYTLSFKVNNLTNEQYWSWNFITPQPPRNVVASVSYKF